MARERKVYSKEFKCQVCDEFLQSSRTLRDVAHSHGLNESVFSRWVKRYREYGSDGFLKRGSKGVSLDKESPVMGPILSRWDRVLPESQVNDPVLKDQLTRLKIMYAEEALEKQALVEILKKTQSNP